jgi:hypothetical protein
MEIILKSAIRNRVCLFLALALSACAPFYLPWGSSTRSMPTLPTAGALTAGATSSVPQLQGAPVVSDSPSQIMVFPFATRTADVTLNQGLGARLYANYTGEDQTAQQAQLAQSTAQNICVQVASSRGDQRLERSLPAAEDPAHG